MGEVVATVSPGRGVLIARRGGGVRPGTRWRASSGHPRCRGRATCVPGPGHCERPAGRWDRSSGRGCGVSTRGAHSSPADRRTGGEKIFCCVTTRRRNSRTLNRLRHGLGALPARFLGLGVPGFGLGVLAMSGLPPRREPAADLPLAMRVLAVALVPAPGLVLAPAPLAETHPRARSAPSGRRAGLWRTLTGAHGRYCSQGNGSGRMSNHPPRALSRREGDAVAPVYRLTGNKTKEETVLERPFKIGDARTDDRPRWLRPNDRNWLRFPDRCHTDLIDPKGLVQKADSCSIPACFRPESVSNFGDIRF
jgi:hypothetical protein